MKTKVHVKKERHFKPHAEFYQAASVLLNHVGEGVQGNYYSLISSLVMMAFAFEAYMNYLGPKVEKRWSDFDNASTLAKFNHISLKLGYEIDFSKSPFQCVRELFIFRNKMAHPRDEKVLEEYIATLEDYEKDFYSLSSPKWLSIATEKKAKQCLVDIGEVMNSLNELLDEPELSPTFIDGGSGSASIIQK